MNYPIWQLPASGLLIAVVAILHVFVSHFAVGGGLFLVLTERKARRENDADLLDYVRRHSRFFVLLTLVFGAISGVGIWFTIGLVHPAATSALINAFVWGWAIEWTFFLTEIAAALVYFYGWDKLTAKEHMIVGWIYFVAAWASLVIINGILTFMLTPGRWLETHAFWDGFFNPTYWPALVLRTFYACGLAGLYALFTASWIAKPELQKKLAKYAILYWIVPMSIGVILSSVWLLSAAASAGVPVAQIFATPTASARDLFASAWSGAKTTGYPLAQRALTTTVVAAIVSTLLALITLATTRKAVLRVVTSGAMIAALFSLGGVEWMREDLRKPYVIGSYMFVNGVGLPAPAGTTAAMTSGENEFAITNVSQRGALVTSRWVDPAILKSGTLTIEEEKAHGKQLFTTLCSQCHTLDGYLAIRPLIAGKSSRAIEQVLDNLAVPNDSAGRPAQWSDPNIKLVTWRNRRMPPFAGTDDEEHALAIYLASIGGGAITPTASADGASVFNDHCGVCHTPDGIPIEPRVAGKSETEIYGLLDRLPQLNAAMPPFEGTDAERKALAGHLAGLAQKGKK